MVATRPLKIGPKADGRYATGSARASRSDAARVAVDFSPRPNAEGLNPRPDAMGRISEPAHANASRDRPLSPDSCLPSILRTGLTSVSPYRWQATQRPGCRTGIARICSGAGPGVSSAASPRDTRTPYVS